MYILMFITIKMIYFYDYVKDLEKYCYINKDKVMINYFPF